MGGLRRTLTLLGTALVLTAGLAGSAQAAMVTQEVDFTASDGKRLHAVVGGEGSIVARPTIIEFSPYAPGCCASIAGPAYNYVQVHARGTGESEGQWSATGPRDQQDVAEFLEWACGQPWSDGRLAIYGFSASAIVAYNAMDLELPCLKTAVLMAGSADLYRDLLYIGGIPNFAAGTAVLTAIGGLTVASGPGRAEHVETAFDPAPGFLQIITDYLAHATEDAYWQDRTLNPSKLRVPILADTGFYDVESRGPFEAFKLTKHLGSQLMVMGAHDGVPAGTSQFPRYERWFDHYVLGEENGIENEARVQTWVGNGSRRALLDGDFTKVDGDDWPLPGTRYTALHLSAERSGTARSNNDGTLRPDPAPSQAVQHYPNAPSNPIATDPYTTATVGAGGADELFRIVPPLTEMNQTEPLSLTYTSGALAQDVSSVGPASLRVRMSSTSTEADIHAVVADVWPDGTAHPVAAGRLRTSFPDTVAERNVVDPESGEIVQPYNDFSRKRPATPGIARDYDVEFWPIGNRFKAGHRIRLYLTGTAGYALPSLPGVNSVTVGGPSRARLVLPSVGGSFGFGAAG